LNPAQHILVFAIRAYRWTISPAQVFIFGPTGGCRFTPTCSQYAIEAIRSRGILTGSALAAKRICRCHPFGGCGHDPVSPGESKIIPHGATTLKTAGFVR
jgi:putative membrane protein insertion efficiency factor